MKEWSVKTKFSDSDVMRTQLGKDFNEFFQDGDFNYGYIIPGHGAKGRQQPINNSNDLKSMYDMYEKRKQIIVWLKVTQGKKPIKRPLYSDDTESSKKFRTEKVGGSSTSHVQT